MSGPAPSFRSPFRQQPRLGDWLVLTAIIVVAALVLPPTSVGITDASITRSFCTPRTRSCGSTTDSAARPMRQLPTGW